MKCKNINQVLDTHKGRFVSVLLKNGLKRELYSAKIRGVSPQVVRFKDTNGGERRVKRNRIVRVKLSKDYFQRSRS